MQCCVLRTKVGGSYLELGLDKDKAIHTKLSIILILQAGTQQENNGPFFNKESNKVYQKEMVQKRGQS